MAQPCSTEMTPPRDVVAIGIDVGTYKCAVACIQRHYPVIISNENGDRLIPMYFGLNGNSKLLHGTLVKKYYHQSVNGFAFGIKRLLRGDQYGITTYDRAAQCTLQSCKDVKFTPTALLIHILKELRNRAAHALRTEDITTVVITVPYEFGPEECRVVVDAAKSAGSFQQIHLITETQAGAIAYVEENDIETPEKNVLVLNYGGGYLEASFFPELSKDCLSKFGKLTCQTMSAPIGAGEELTQLIMGHLGDRAGTEFDGFQLTKKPEFQHKFRQKAGELKANIWAGKAVQFSITDIKPDEDFEGTFTLKEFEHCIKPLCQSVEECLQGFADSIAPVQSIVLTGGSTRLRVFRRMLERVFPKAVLKESINAEEAAVNGAALLAQNTPSTVDDCGRLLVFRAPDKYVRPYTSKFPFLVALKPTPWLKRCISFICSTRLFTFRQFLFNRW